jgi:hypothetical protein
MSQGPEAWGESAWGDNQWGGELVISPESIIGSNWFIFWFINRKHNTRL